MKKNVITRRDALKKIATTSALAFGSFTLVPKIPFDSSIKVMNNYNKVNLDTQKYPYLEQKCHKHVFEDSWPSLYYTTLKFCT